MKIAILFDGASAFAESPDQEILGTVEAVSVSLSTEGNSVVLYGVHDLVVVARDGLVLVTTVDRSTDLKTLLDSLPAGLRDRK